MAEGPLDALTVQFNTLLLAEIDSLRTTLAGVTIFEFDTWAVMQDMLTNPAAFGFTNVTDPAYVGPLDGTGTVVPNPQEYLYWDEVHPSTIAHGHIAAAALTAIPEPSTVILAAMGLIGLAAFGWRRRKR